MSKQNIHLGSQDYNSDANCKTSTFDPVSDTFNVEKTTKSISIAEPGKCSVQKRSSDGSEDINQTFKEPYTMFTTPEKYILTIIASTLALFSSISVPIYLPVLTELENYFHVTTEQINLTIVTYSIFQGIAPAFWGPLADKFGRRTIYPLCVIVYIGANVGLAMASKYGMLLGFRCLQAAGMAASVAIGAGLIGDITQRKNRGTFIGIFSGLTLVGNALGPLIGAGLANAWGWRSIFWCLVISSGVMLVIVIIILPETNRAFVGNGSIRPKYWFSLAPSMIALHHKILIKYEDAVRENKGLLAPRQKTSMFRAITIFWNKDVPFILIPAGLHYTTWFVVLTVQSTALSKTYHFNTIQLGISYLANGVGSILGSVCGGKFLSYYYQRRLREFIKKWASQNGPDSQPDISKFDIVAARIMPCFWLSPFMVAGSIIFGWTIDKHVHWIVPIMMTLIISFTGVTFVNMGQTLMVDFFPGEASSASGCVNLVRCLLCVVGLAVIDKMISAMGTGWAITLVALISLISLVGVYIEYIYGMEWNQERMCKMNSKDDTLFS